MHQHGSAQPGLSEIISTLTEIFGPDIVRLKLQATTGLTLSQTQTLSSKPKNEDEVIATLLKEFQELAPTIMEHVSIKQKFKEKTPDPSPEPLPKANSPVRDDIQSITNQDVQQRPQSSEWLESISGHVINEQLLNINPNF